MIFTAIGPSLLKGVLKYWKEILLVAAVVGLYLYWNGLTSKIEKLEQDNITLIEEKAQITAHYELEIRNIQAAISKQNLQVRKLKQEGDTLTIKLREANIKVATTRTVYETEIKRILDADAPQTCEDAIEYLIRSTEELTW